MSLYGFKEITFQGLEKEVSNCSSTSFDVMFYRGKPPKNPLKTDLCFRLNQSFSSRTCFFHEFFSKLKDFWEYFFGAALLLKPCFNYMVFSLLHGFGCSRVP